MKKNIVTKSVDETKQFAQNLAATMRGGEVLLLFGELGAGKTTFMQGFAQGLGISKRIISPTFLVMRSYSFEKDIMSKDASLYHIDLYRLDSKEAIKQIGLSEYIGKKEAIVAIEWPEKLGTSLPEKRIEIRITPMSEQKRNIEVVYV